MFFTSSLASYILKVEVLEQIFHLCVVARLMKCCLVSRDIRE